MIVAKPPGMPNGLKMIHSMGVFGSPDQACQSVRNRLAADRKFKERWVGYQLLPTIVDYFVSVEQNGSVLMHQNDQEPARHG